MKSSIKKIVATTTYENIKMEDNTRLVLGTYVANSAVGKKHEKQAENVLYDGIEAKGNARGYLDNMIGGESASEE